MTTFNYKMTRSKTPILDQNTVDLLVSTLKSDGDANDQFNIDPHDTGSIIKHLLTAFLMMHKEVAKLKEEVQDGGGWQEAGGAGKEAKKEVEKLQERIRAQEDETDEVRQRSLKGNLILSSPQNADKNLHTLLKSDETLAAERTSLTDHVLDLINTKYGVRIPKSDLQALHRLPNSSIVIRVWNRTEGSAWSVLINRIKMGGKKEMKSMNVFLSFHLTRRRSELVKELKKQKRLQNVYKFYTDENGAITFRDRQDGLKVKITYAWNRECENPKTLTVNELIRLVK